MVIIWDWNMGDALKGQYFRARMPENSLETDVMKFSFLVFHAACRL